MLEATSLVGIFSWNINFVLFSNYFPSFSINEKSSILHQARFVQTLIVYLDFRFPGAIEFVMESFCRKYELQTLSLTIYFGIVVRKNKLKRTKRIYGRTKKMKIDEVQNGFIVSVVTFSTD